RIAGWITEINRMRAVGPIELGLNGDAMLFQMFPPAVDLGAACGKTYMTRPRRAMRWHGQMIGQWRLQGFFRLEEKQYAFAAAEESVAVADFPNRLQPHRSLIELYRLGDIADIERGFKNAGGTHGSGLLIEMEQA